jgi:hypothetical protein
VATCRKFDEELQNARGGSIPRLRLRGEEVLSGTAQRLRRENAELTMARRSRGPLTEKWPFPFRHNHATANFRSRP